jgi:hypothetical protein
MQVGLLCKCFLGHPGVLAGGPDILPQTTTVMCDGWHYLSPKQEGQDHSTVYTLCLSLKSRCPQTNDSVAGGRHLSRR